MSLQIQAFDKKLIKRFLLLKETGVMLHYYECIRRKAVKS